MYLLVQPLRAHTRLDMTRFDGREIGHSNTSCARYERCHCEHHMTAKGSRHAFDMAKARVRSVPAGVCMSTPHWTGAALDMMHFIDGREVDARSSKRCARSRRNGGAVWCEHILSANGSREAFGRGQSKHAECFCACVGGCATHDPCDAQHDGF